MVKFMVSDPLVILAAEPACSSGEATVEEFNLDLSTVSSYEDIGTVLQAIKDQDDSLFPLIAVCRPCH